VADAWSRPSVLEQWSVGGLAAHLGGQVLTAERLLRLPPSDLAPIDLDDHYAEAAWVSASIDDPVNTGIREGGEQEAAAGPVELLARVRSARVAVASALSLEPPDRVVLIPWQGWALTLDDFLTTRTMEIVVHSDDLAASVGIEAPAFDRAVLDPVLGLLTRLAVRRHGQSAVVAALARQERAPGSIAAF
jgi:uncharacterized protein (TIGR03083 family)